MSLHTKETELDILEKISSSNSGMRQRDLARIIGLSLGMTNAILKRLAQKGWLKVKKVNNRNIQYIVSPQGMQKIAHRSYRYFRRTIKNVVYYKEVIESLVREAVARDYEGILLVGKSDLDFIVEHLCIKYRLRFQRTMPGERKAKTHDRILVFYAETIGENGLRLAKSVSLRQIIMADAARRRQSVKS
jgi:DNA-binding MarR family transcriptional regulator